MLFLCDVSVSYSAAIKCFNGGFTVKQFGGLLGVLGDFLQINSEI